MIKTCAVILLVFITTGCQVDKNSRRVYKYCDPTEETRTILYYKMPYIERKFQCVDYSNKVHIEWMRTD